MLKTICVSLALTFAFILPFQPSAEARTRHHHHHYQHHRVMQPYAAPSTRADYGSRYGETTAIGGRPAGCPHAYCGCATSLRIFGRVIPSLNLASAWFRFPRTAPAPGMVAVRNHHVMVIQSVDANGNATVYDPNGGNHRTWIHTRSLHGYAVVNPYGSRMARL